MYPNINRRAGREPPLGDSRSASQGNPPPPSPLQSSSWDECIGPIHMSQPQNNVNAPGDSVHRNGENIPTTNAQHDIHDLTGTTKADHKIYANQLLNKGRGYPLWVPGPGMQLPIEYRRQGINIGDVGIITSTGEFDFLFNILQPPEHAVNGGSVPHVFSPIPRQELGRDIQETIVYGPNTHLASSSVRKTSMKWISETSIDQGFESTAKEAAILIMPDGATTRNLLNTWGFRDTISSNAKDWYTYTRNTCGLYVKNGDIRVVVGVDKVSSWGIATSACDSGQTASYVFKNHPTHTYHWDCIGGSGRVGPQKREIRDLIEDNGVPENQCVFVRTINFTLSRKMWNDFSSEGVQQRSSGPWLGRSGRWDSASSNRGGGHSTSGGGNTSSGYQPGSMQGLYCDLSVKLEPVELGVHHPSAALHNVLHEKFPDAKMVITEDMDWISVLNDDDMVFPNSEDLCERVLKVHVLHNHQGVVQIVRKDDHWRPSTSMKPGKDENVLERAISSAIGKVRTSQAKTPTNTLRSPAPPKEKRHRIGRGLHTVRAPLNPPLISGINSVFRNRKNSSPLESSHPLPTPFSGETNSMAPIPVVPSHSAQDDGGECPACLEPLSFSARLPDEKPHISTLPNNPNLGVCGVCRRPMKVADGDGGKSNKLAPLPGPGDSHNSPLFLGKDTSVARNRAAVKPLDPTDDDPLEHNSRKKPQSGHGQHIVAPLIHVRPEFSSLILKNGTNQHLTCVVVVELPGRVPGRLSGPVTAENYGKPRDQHSSSGPSSPHADSIPRHRKNRGSDESFQNQLSDTHYTSTFNGPQTHDSNTLIHSEEDSPFHSITEDLRNRIMDWKGHPFSDLGHLQMYDLLTVRRGAALRDFQVYLFQEAIICVAEKKRDLTSYMAPSKGALRLKGRIYVRHIKNVTALLAPGEMSLTIDVEDELASITLIFTDRASLKSWKNNIKTLVDLYHAQNGLVRAQEPERLLDLEPFRGSRKTMRRLSGSSTTSTVDSLLNDSGQSRTFSSIRTSPGSPTQGTPLGEDDQLSNYDDSSSNLATSHTPSGPSNFLSPLPHTHMDLILVISLPPPKSLPSTAQLKIRVIKATLDFLVAHLGPKDRLSLVTFEVGMEGNVRKTPFLLLGSPPSRAKLENFIDETGVKIDENKDESLVRGSKEEKTDVVTAVNHALDVCLQRKGRNSVTGLVLISDASNSIRRAQMDLVLARAEAASVPIHSFGYGRLHDPAFLLLVSNRTSGTYTFVKDWYDLQDCVAGCVGGMMSIGLLNVKLRLKVVDSYHFKIRKVSGCPQFVLSADGQNVDVDVGELRYGEKKEILIELKQDNNNQQRLAQERAGRHRAMNATDQFVQSLGLDTLTIDEGPDLVDGMMDGLIEEVSVLEVDGSFFDPATAKSISRLAHPTLLSLLGSQDSKPLSTVSDPVIVRRRMELLASDMITRALLLVSRQNFPQALKILDETKRILHTVLKTVSRSLSLQTDCPGTRNSKELSTLAAVRVMQAVLQDLQLLSEALEDNVELFVHDQRNFGAQQAMILKDQRSWSGRSATERLFWTIDHSIELVSRSIDWVARD